MKNRESAKCNSPPSPCLSRSNALLPISINQPTNLLLSSMLPTRYNFHQSPRLSLLGNKKPVEKKRAAVIAKSNNSCCPQTSLIGRVAKTSNFAEFVRAAEIRGGVR